MKKWKVIAATASGLAAGAVVMALLVVSGVISFSNKPSTLPTPAAPTATLQQTALPTVLEQAVLTEFLDFNCSYCAQFADQILPRLREEFVETGMLRIEYRNYPFLAETSFMAAQGAECAREQGKFNEYHDSLFRTRTNKPEAGRQLGTDDLATAAQESGVEPVRFVECLESERGDRAVEEDLELGRRVGVRGTPTLFLNGRYLEWNNYQDLRDKIRRAASGEDW